MNYIGIDLEPHVKNSKNPLLKWFTVSYPKKPNHDILSLPAGFVLQQSGQQFHPGEV